MTQEDEDAMQKWIDSRPDCIKGYTLTALTEDCIGISAGMCDESNASMVGALIVGMREHEMMIMRARIRARLAVGAGEKGEKGEN